MISGEKDAEWTGLKFSPDGKTILISTNSSLIRLIDAFNGKLMQVSTDIFTIHQVLDSAPFFYKFLNTKSSSPRYMSSQFYVFPLNCHQNYVLSPKNKDLVVDMDFFPKHVTFPWSLLCVIFNITLYFG